jgi:tetratricopeptide (TPR) repeat protein
MEPREHHEHGQHEAFDSPREGDGAPGNSKGATDPAGQPERTMVVQVGPSGRGHTGDRARSGQHGRDQTGQSPQGHSPTLGLLLSGIVALACGAAGAWGYTHYLASEKSAEKESGSTKDSQANKNPASNDKDSGNQAQAEVEAARRSALNEVRQAKAAEQSARKSEEEKKAVLDFLKNSLLTAGRPGDGSLTDAFWAAGQGKDVTLRKAIDLAEAQVSNAFADRPVAEVAVREMLGMGYVNVGEPARAVQQYERALALREAVQGDNDPETAACRNQLAVVYRLAGRTAEAARLFDRNPDSAIHANALAVRGMTLLIEKKPAEAELKLRECLTIRRKVQPDDWTTFDTESLLGQALLDQKKYAEAEPLLVSGFEGMKKRDGAIPAREKGRLTRAIERLVSLYEARGEPDKAAKWRNELKVSTAAKSAEIPSTKP